MESTDLQAFYLQIRDAIMNNDLMKMREFVLICMTIADKSDANDSMMMYVQNLKPNMSKKDEENLCKLSLLCFSQATSTQQEEISLESLIGEELVELFEETWIEVADQWHNAEESKLALPVHMDSSIITRVDTCIPIDDMIKKKQDEEALTCRQAIAIEENWEDRLIIIEMIHDVEHHLEAKPKFYEVNLNPVHAIYKEWLTEEDKEELRQRSFWENLNDLSQFPEEQPLQSTSETSQEDFRETTVHIEDPTMTKCSSRKMEGKTVNWTADQPSNRLPSRPSENMNSEICVTDSMVEFNHTEPIIVQEAVFKTPVPFARRKFDLSIYTFDDPDDDDIIEDVSNDLIEAADEDYTDGEDSVKKSNHTKHIPKLKKVKSKAERSHLKLTKNLSSFINPLKRKHWNSGK